MKLRKWKRLNGDWEWRTETKLHQWCLLIEGARMNLSNPTGMLEGMMIHKTYQYPSEIWGWETPNVKAIQLDPPLILEDHTAALLFASSALAWLRGVHDQIPLEGLETHWKVFLEHINSKLSGISSMDVW